MMQKAPFFTVGILTYNYASYIKQAIESVLNQTYRNWELFIYDDASRDNTEEIVKKYLTDSRVIYIKNKKNIGQAANWAQALKSGTGIVLCTLHADDFWEKDTLHKVRSTFQSDTKLDIYYTNWKVVDSDNLGPVKNHYSNGVETFEKEIKKYTMLPSATFIRRSLVLRCDAPSLQFKYAVDNNYFFRLMLKANYIRSDKSPQLNYRVHALNATAASYCNGEIFKEVHMNLNFLKREAKSSKLKKLIDNNILLNHLNYASYSLRQGNLIEGRLELQKCLNYRIIEASLLANLIKNYLKYLYRTIVK